MKKAIRIGSRYVLTACCMCWCALMYAQQYTNNPLSQYFRNGYLWNPAYAGSKDQPVGYVLHNNSWIGFEGAPALNTAAAHFAFGAGSGMGAKIMLDKSGILQRNTYMLDYSYTLRFTGSKNLRMGVSAGAFSQRLQPAATDMGDPSLYAFTGNKTVVDGNLGAVFNNKQFMFGAVVYNLRAGHLQKTDSYGDMATANIMTSFSFFATPGDSTLLKPLLAYKMFSQSNDVFTAGIQLERSKVFNAAILWQSTGNIIGSVGLRIGKVIEINCSYSSNNKYGYGQAYEIGAGFGFH